MFVLGFEFEQTLPSSISCKSESKCARLNQISVSLRDPKAKNVLCESE